jgi:hypothetical protein
MTLDEFRNHDKLPGDWATLLAENRVLQIVLAVMEDNHPAHFAIQGDSGEDVSPTRAAIELGLTRGYSKYGDTLRLLARRKRKPEPLPEATYEPEPVE